MDTVTRATLVAKRMIDAREGGNDEEADRLQSQLHNGFDDDTLRIVLAAMLASAGRQQGWLPEADYDRLRSMTDTTGPALDVLLGEIRRGRPAGA